jgi:hypothetical protein
MPECLPGLVVRRLAVYRQRIIAAPVLLPCETLSRGNAAQVVHEAQIEGRERRFPPDVPLGTLLLQVWRPEGSCRAAVTRLRAFQVAQGERDQDGVGEGYRAEQNPYDGPQGTLDVRPGL